MEACKRLNNKSSFEIVILRGVISVFYMPTSVDLKKKLGFLLVVLRVTKVISQWQGVYLKIDHGFFRVIGPKCDIKSHFDI